MKLQDKETLNVADAVKNVLEGKVKEEAKYPHDMFHPETGEKEVAKNEDEHKALSKKGYTHEKPDVDEVAEPEAKGEKEFKSKHTVKKTGADEKGQVTSESKDDDKDEDEDSKEEGNAFGKAVMAAKEKGDKTFVFAGKKYDVKTKSEVKDEDEDDKEEVEERSMTPMKDKFGPDKNLVKKAVDLALKMSGNMTGATKKIEKMQKGLSKDKEVAAALQLANEEKVDEELSAKQKKYQAFFAKALKKFGVKSPAELEGDKKKEFYDYVDANYEADNESD